jgi:hypothetical protein
MTQAGYPSPFYDLVEVEAFEAELVLPVLPDGRGPYALMLAEMIDLSAGFTPALAAYWERLERAPSFARALKAEHEAAVAQGVSPVPAPLMGSL